MKRNNPVSVSTIKTAAILGYVDRIKSFRLLDRRKGFSTTHRTSVGASFLVDSSSSGYDMLAEDTGSVLFTVPLWGSVTRENGNATMTASPGKFQLLFPSSRTTRVRSNRGRNFRALSLFTPLADLRSRLGIPGETVLGNQEFSRILQTVPEIGGGSALTSFMLQFHRRQALYQAEYIDRANELAHNLMSELLVELLLRIGEQIHANDTVPASMKAVRMAEERMWAASCEAVSIANIAREIGVGVRSLQLGFRVHRGKTPKDALSQIRLSNARLALLSAGPEQTVTQVALSCGIVHFGRFSSMYRNAYGELPSKTLARVQSLY